MIYALGFLAQICFSARLLIQWIISEKEKQVVSPTLFWLLSLLGSYLLFFYGWLRNDFAIILGQLISYYIYIWNLNMKNRYTSVSAYEKALQAWDDAQGIGDKPMLQIPPTVRWENTIDIKATKYLSTTFNFQLYYNRAQNYDIQTQLLLSVGLTYTFKNI